jgi:16S rRNA (guanine966-N2)-methyltransferase
MRIVGGAWGGRRLQAPPGDATRPTSDRVREALFSILGERVRDARVLDLFAGSGALGLEALSRGAAEATFVDSAAAPVRALRANLESLGAERSGGDRSAPDRTEVRRQDALRFLGSARSAARDYDLVFLDPPYRLANRLGGRLSEELPHVLAPGATVVTESDRRNPLDLDLPISDERRYGDTLIRIHAPR